MQSSCWPVRLGRQKAIARRRNQLQQQQHQQEEEAVMQQQQQQQQQVAVAQPPSNIISSNSSNSSSRRGRTPGSLPLLSARCYLDAVNLPYDSMRLTFRQGPASPAEPAAAAAAGSYRLSFLNEAVKRRLLSNEAYEKQGTEFYSLLNDSGITQSRSTNDLTGAAAAATAAAAAAAAAAAPGAATGGDASDSGRPTSRERRRERRLLMGSQQQLPEQQEQQQHHQHHQHHQQPLQSRQPRRQHLAPPRPPPPPQTALATDAPPLPHPLTPMTAAGLGELEIRTTQPIVLQRREATQRSFIGGCCGPAPPGGPSRQSSFGSSVSDAAVLSEQQQQQQQQQLDASGSFCYSPGVVGHASRLAAGGRGGHLLMSSSYSGVGFHGSAAFASSSRRPAAGAASGNGSAASATVVEKYRFSDPSTGASSYFCHRLVELTSLVSETLRYERGRTGRTKRK